MKIFLRRSPAAGSALLVTLVTAVIIGITLSSYLDMTSAQNTAVTRSQVWNTAIPVCEAGVEEALTQLYYNYTNLSANSWSSNAGCYHMSRSLNGGRFHAMISNCNPPVIYSIGHVVKPFSTNELARRIRVDTIKNALFAKGMVAKGNIGWVGSIKSDSFDSQNPTYSTGGRYDSTKNKDGGSVGSVNGSITMGGGIIYGAASTGPFGSVTGGTVGDFAWVAGSSGIESGHYDNTMNVSFPDVTVPFTNGYFTAFDPGVTAVTTNYTYGTLTVTNTLYPNPVPAGGVTTISTTVTNSSLPNPVPAGGVTTNSATAFVSTTKPNPVPASGVSTNTSTSSGSTYPSPVPNGGVGTNSTHYTAVAKNSVPANAVNVITNAANSMKRDYDIYTYISTNITYSYTNFTYTYSAPAYVYVTTSTNATTTSTTYTYSLLGGNYQISSWPNGNPTIYVVGNVTLYMPNGFSMSGQGGITMGPGATLAIYTGGDVTIAGQGIVNGTGDATRFALYGLPTCSEVKVAGNASFTGTLYAPEATLKDSGGGNNTYDFVGACIVGAVTMNGHTQFHYDENLGRNGPGNGFLVSTWNEY